MSHGDEENEHRARTNGHLTTADQSEIRKAYLASVPRGAHCQYTSRAICLQDKYDVADLRHNKVAVQPESVGMHKR